jgi:hypothetical protein
LPNKILLNDLPTQIVSIDLPLKRFVIGGERNGASGRISGPDDGVDVPDKVVVVVLKKLVVAVIKFKLETLF